MGGQGEDGPTETQSLCLLLFPRFSVLAGATCVFSAAVLAGHPVLGCLEDGPQLGSHGRDRVRQERSFLKLHPGCLSCLTIVPALLTLHKTISIKWIWSSDLNMPSVKQLTT